MPIISEQHDTAFREYRRCDALTPVLLLDDANIVLSELPAGSVDCVMTSPPYWAKREYENGGIGQEPTSAEYIDALETAFAQVSQASAETDWFFLAESGRHL